MNFYLKFALILLKLRVDLKLQNFYKYNRNPKTAKKKSNFNEHQDIE